MSASWPEDEDNVIPFDPQAREAKRESEAKIPPHSLEAEAAALAAMMIDRTQILRVIDFLRPEHFYSEAHRRICEAIYALHDSLGADDKIDVVLVATWLKDRQRIEQVGGIKYITVVESSLPQLINARIYAEIVFDQWRVRQAIAASQLTSATGYLGTGDVQPYLEGAARRLIDIARQRADAKYETNDVTIRKIHAKITGEKLPREAEVPITGISTGLRTLDAKTSGLHRGDKLTIVAPSSVGKTALMLEICINAALAGEPCLVFVSEMTKEELGIRQLSVISRVDIAQIKLALVSDNVLTDEEYDRYVRAAVVLSDPKFPLKIIDDPDLTMDQICAITRAEAETCVLEFGAELAIVGVDGVQRLPASAPVAGHGNNTETQVRYSTKTFTKMLKELKLCGLEAAQMKSADRDNPVTKLPVQGRAAESIWIEREAATVIYLWCPEPASKPENVTLVITKQRGGRKGARIPMHFDGSTQRFVDRDLIADRTHVAPATNGTRRWFDGQGNERDDDE